VEEVSHCCQLTDVGIAGAGPETEDEERVSIQRLKGLTTLHFEAGASPISEISAKVRGSG